MMKRIIALLLALILTVGLLPTVALAAEGTAKPIASVRDNDSSGNVHVKKEIYQNDDGTYKVRLESWATGTQTVTEKHLPMDIVLVLDVSGSMKEEDVVSSAGTPTKVSKSENNENLKDKAAANNLFVLVDSNYYPVTVTKQNPSGSGYGRNTTYTYSYTKDGSTVNLGTYKGDKGTYSNSTMPLYSVQSNNYITRLDALKNAVNAFIDNVAKEAKDKEVDHKISIVKFAGNEERKKIGNDTYTKGNNTYNYTQIVKNLTPANVDANVTALKEAVNALNYGGATQADFGMNRAAEALGSFTSADVQTRGKIVIMFTDGEPTDYQNYDNGVAGNAVAKARELKDKGAKVYTIAMIDSANPSDTSRKINRYMNGVSSNYPQATKCDSGYYIDHWYHYGVDLGTRGDGSYYQAASSSADSLKKIFDAISKDISNNTTALDGAAILFDELPENFEIPANAQNITTKTADYTGENTWGADTTVTNLTIKPKNNNTLFEITGFNYADNWCGKRTDNSYGGKKLIVEFNIQHDNYGGTQPTNKSAGISNEEEEDALVIVPNPSIAVPIAPPSITDASATKVYDGTGIDVLANVAAEADKLVTGENEGKNAFVDIIVKVKDANNEEYTYTIPAGETTGSWSPEHTEFKTPADVKIKSDGSVGEYSYDLSIIYQDKAQTNPAAPKTATGEAEYTITKRPVTLISASDEKKWDGTALTNDTVTVSAGEGNTVGGFVTGEGATYNVTGSQTEVGKSDNTFDYTLNNNTKATNYEITKQLGELEVTQNDTEITVTITGNTLTTPYSGSEQSVTGFDYTVSGGSATKADVIVALKENKTARAAGTNAGKYMMGLSKEDSFTVTSSKYSNVKITTVNDGYLEITPLAVTLTSGSGSKEYDGEPLTNATVEATGEGASRFVQEVNDFKANGSVKGTADMTTAQSVTNNITYTWKEGFSASNYTITTTPGTLTITPVSQFKITFKTDLGGTINGDTQDVEVNAKRNDSFPAVPTTEANNGYYFLGWYDESGNKVEENAFPEKVTGNATYTAKWLSYKSINLDLTRKIQKTLNSDVALTNEIFTINLTLNGAEVPSATATATATATVSPALDNGSYTDTKPFVDASGDFKLTFTAPGTYIYSIVEEAPVRSGMTYDVNKPTGGHELTVNVTADDTTHALSFESVTVDGTADTDATWLTITNNYVEPKETFNLNTLIKKHFTKADDSAEIPNENFTFTATIESYPNKEDTYIGTVTMNGAENDKYFDFGDSKNLTLTPGTYKYRVTEELGTDTRIRYDSSAYILTISVEDDGSYNVSVVQEAPAAQSLTTAAAVFPDNKQITFTNTYFEKKDPNALYLDFSKFVKKELTATGSKTVDEATFIVDVVGSYDGEAIANALTPTEAQATTDEDVLNTTLTATIKNVVGGNVYEEPFTGSVTVSKPGHYTFTLTERKGTQSGVTYDEAHYRVFVNIMRVGDNLVIHDATTYLNNEQVELIKLENDAPVTAGYIVFKNTIDTGKDDYYPIIIPTIINKDTGMLNKTDHFAYVIGYPDGTVHPNGQITRAEVATIFFRLLKDEVRDGAFTTSNTYSDVAYGKWYNNPISTMSALGIITGYPDGTFKPNKPITRAEFAAIAARFDETQSGKSATFSDVIGHWAAKEIGIAYYNDWIKGYPDGTFKPDQNITRAEAMTMINRVLERKPESPADLLTNMNKWTDNLDTSKWYYLDVQEATNSHGYTRKTFNYELWRQMLPDPDWSRYER